MEPSPSGITYYFTDKGTDQNEDFVYCCSKFGIVLDGASGLGEQCAPPNGFQTTSQWYSHSLGSELIPLLEKGASACEAIDSAAKAVARKYYLLPGRSKNSPNLIAPSSTVAIATRDGESVHFAWLGDSPMLVVSHDKVTLLMDEALGAVDSTALDAMVTRSRGKSLSGIEKRALIMDVLIANRKKRNTPEAYWILDPSLAGLSHIHSCTLPLAEVECVIGMSDGLFAAIEKYGLFSINEAPAAFKSYSMTVGLVYRMRCVESADADLTRYPRFKKSDDASIFHLALQ